ncbi:MAG: TonB-dependent receptor [bacterium]
MNKQSINKFITVVVIIFFSVIALFAQEKHFRLQGTVVDAETGKPLYGANVMVISTVLGDATDNKGHFIITGLPAGTYDIKATMMGYTGELKKDILVGSDRDTSITFSLHPTVIEQPAVMVTASKRKQSTENIASSFEVIGRRDIETRNVQSLEEIVQKSSGVNIVRGQVDFRGSTGFSWAAASRVMFMLDGHPVISGDTEGINWNIVPVNDIQRVEIIKGSGSSLYGSNAMAGMINIITKEPSSKPVTRFKTYWGFYDQPSYKSWRWTDNFLPYQISQGEADLSRALTYEGINISHSRRIGKVGMLFSGSRETSSGYKQNDNSSKWNFFGKVNIKFTPDIFLQVSGIRAQHEHDEFIQWVDQSRALEVPEDKIGDWVLSRRTNINGTFNHTLNKNMTYSLRLSFYRNYWKNHFSDNRDFSGSNRYSTEGRFNYIHKNHDFTFGTELNNYNTNSNFYGDRGVREIAFYAEDEAEIIEDIRIKLGARYDYHQVIDGSSDHQVSPRLGTIIKPWKGSLLRLSAGYGFRAPSIAELFTKTIVSGFTVEPNPDLTTAEKVWAFELGFKQQVALKTDKTTAFSSNPLTWFLSRLDPAFMFDLSFFWHRYENMIEPQQAYMPDSTVAIQFQYLDRARNRGIEAKLQFSAFKGMLRTWAGYTCIDPVNLKTNAVLSYRSKQRFSMGVVLQYKWMAAGWDYQYASRMVNIVNLDGSAFEQRVPMHVMDGRLNFDLRTFLITLECKNMLNYNYILRQRYVEPIRSYVVSLQGEF